ncbi:MAG TPA: choice-of-anchor D domain-containing protein [Acidobacteriaceae bacterium]|nr:choice-of-anchor D domain-containing protein [Acidobacteriaceae bacterium]
MKLASAKALHVVVCAAATLFALLPVRASAQQITYYNFDTPATASPLQYSYTCSAANPSANPLFCLNDGTGTMSNPLFIQDPVGSGTWATQMTPDAASQAGSLWFSVPQVVSGGFNAWFEFKLTPDNTGYSYATADGIAFVIQNAHGGGAVDPSSGCQETGSGPTVLGGGGGCLGYSGIDNSVALEFDTYFNSFDPDEAAHGNFNDDNHIALQDCGAGQVNSAAHIASDSGPACEVYLPGPDETQIPTLVSNPNASLVANAAPVPVVLSDGNVHQVVVVYNGPSDSPANYLYVYLDPAFDPGTVTPVAGSVPLFSGPYDITQALNLLDTGSGPNSAYIGFTSATGAAFEQNELVGWTFTPHTPVTQQQPLQPAGSPTYTQFPYGTHTYGVQYPGDGPATTGTSMTVTANTVSPTLFSQLIAGTPFQGSACQVYDDTGGNCIIYSVSCFVTGHPDQVVACPAVTSVPNCIGANAASCINVKTVFNSSVTPVSPGYLQGDPFFSQISALNVSGDTANFTCTGECSVTIGQTVSVIGATPAGFNGSYTVTSVSAPNAFVAQTAVGASGSATTAGYLTSNNLQNIFVSYTPANIDGTSKGTTLNFSDFVFTSVTNNATTQTQLSAASMTPTLGQPDLLTATVAGSATQIAPPTGNVLFYAGATLLCSSPVSTTAGVTTATCSYTPTTTGPSTITAQYLGDTAHLLSNATPLILTIPVGQMLNINPSSIDFGTLYLGSIVTKIVTVTNTGTGAVTIHDPLIAIVKGGNSKEFVTLNLCPKSLAAGKSCVMTVTFIAGPYYTPQTATLTINDSAAGSPHTVPLTATVINPIAKFSTGSLNFGKVKTGTTSSPQSVTITNTGATSLTISNVSVSGGNAADFHPTNGCTAPLAPKGTCSIGVTFKPAAKGSRSATLIVTDNAFNSPQAISLSGTGN